MDLNQQSLRMLAPKEGAKENHFPLTNIQVFDTRQASNSLLVPTGVYNILQYWYKPEQQEFAQFRASAFARLQECFSSLCLPLGDSTQAAIHPVWKKMTPATELPEKLHHL